MAEQNIHIPTQNHEDSPYLPGPIERQGLVEGIIINGALVAVGGNLLRHDVVIDDQILS